MAYQLLTLNSNRIITLESIAQRKTYSGMLAGLPNSKINDMIIESAVMQTNKQRHTVAHLIDPVRTNHELHGKPYERIPAICCNAFFDSGPKKFTNNDLSFLCIVWFQEEFAMPIADDILSKIMAVDWDKHAIGGDY